MIIDKHVNILACPECKSNINELKVNDHLSGFFCETCKFIYPIKEDILVLLPIRARSRTLEYDLVLNIRKELVYPGDMVEQYISNTLNLLDTLKDKKSWEWEDEQFWSKEYGEKAGTVVQKDWNDRIWQREFLVKHLLYETKLNSRIILDVGCGEGQTFRALLSKYCDETTLYVATDISLEGLKLNRSRSAHKNSLYILCSADNLPFHKETIDILCYFGVLHHTERKTRTLPQDISLLKKDSYILIHEALERPVTSSFLPGFLKPKREESAHEERIKRKELLTQISNIQDIKILDSRESHTIFLGGMMRFFKNIMIKNKTFFNLISSLDILFMRLFKNIVPFFRPSEIMLLLKKSR